MNGLDTHDPLSSDNIKLEDCTKSENININNDVSPRSFSDVEELWSKKSLDNYSDDDLSVSSGKDAKTCALSDEQTKSSQHKSLQNPDVNESPNENGELTGIASDDDVSSVSTVILQCEDNDVNDIPKNDKLIADDGNSLDSTVSFDDGNLNNKPNSKEQHTDDAKSSFGTLVLESIEEINVDDGSKSGVQCNDDETSLVSSQDIFNSDCDDSKSNDIFLEIPIVDVDKIKNQNDTINPVIHEINSDNSDNDDCVVTSVEKLKTPVKRKNVNKATITTAKLRRSGRAVSKKKYTDDIEEIDDESDLEEIIVKNTPIKPKTANSKAKLPPGTTTKTERKLDPRDPLATKSHPERKDANIPQSRKSTSIISKNNNNVTAPQPIQEIKPPEPILPTLTDDMFVVEAPSFIIPYVYEKPAPILLKEFVAKWSKEMDELNIKLENQFKETQKAEQEKREKEKQERQERRERGEIVPNSEEEDIEKKESNNEKKSEKKVKRRRKRDDDDVSWDGSGSEESDDESISDDGSQKDAVISEIPEVKQLVTPRKIDPYFETTLGKFFIDIGTNLIQEYVQTDLLHQQKLKLRREMRAGRNIKKLQSSVTLLSKNLELSQKNNKSFKFEQKQCKICNYKSESALALESHRRTLHMRNNMYICSFCPFEVLGPYNMITHMDTVHAIRGIYDPPPATNQCTQCMFEVQGKSKLSRHLINCEKKFKPSTNLAPPPEWEPPAKILKISNVRAPVPYHTAQFTRLAQVGTTLSGAPVRISIDNALTSPTFRPRMAFTPPRLPGITIKHATTLQNNSSVGDATKKSSNSIIMNPSSQQDGPIQNQNSNTKNIVMCEICDGYIKNLEQLRNHMQWVHKVKIHPKMINNRPPLNCQKCQFRFFTDQGLERHLLGAHGLVTSAIQELANKGKDGGRCPVCGRAYQKKLLAHVSRDHSLVLKPANLSYKCTVCMATFGLYRQFESHVYSAHSTVVKKDNKKIVLKGKTNNIVAPNGAAK